MEFHQSSAKILNKIGLKPSKNPIKLNLYLPFPKL
jgi:hypothetical protein